MNNCAINNKLWNETPVIYNKEDNFKDNTEYSNLIFPSARQALTEGLIKAKIKRGDRVAVPEWITNCVIGAISKVAMVIPIKEVIKYSIPVDAALLYEQWGWTYLPEIKEEILSSINTKLFILDKVDSADIDNKNSICFYPNFNEIELRSLSKTIGLKGGGLIKYNKEYLEFNYNRNDDKLCKFIMENDLERDIESKLLHINKSEISALHPQVEDYINNYDIFESLRYESQKRRTNLNLIASSELSKAWQGWMFKAIENGTAPGIVPVFLGYPDKLLNDIVQHMKENCKINSAVYNFNIAGNPVKVDYRKCYALPIHSNIKDMDLIINELKKFL